MHHARPIATKKRAPLAKTLVLAGLGLAALPLSAHAAPGLTPHRAVYDLKLADAQDRSGIRAARGRLAVEISAAGCEGWTVNVRFVNQFTLRRGKSSVLDIQNSSFETTDGQTMDFTSREYVNGKLQTEAKGRARIAGGTGAVAMTKPTEETFDLPKNTAFPLAHTRRLLGLAREGKTIDEINLYEGSAEKKVFTASSVIGKKREPGAAKHANEGKHNDVLKLLTSWPMTVSYYDPVEKVEGEQVPSHQMSFQLFDNGVTGDLTIDYGDFKMKGALTHLEMLELPGCE
ncbi:MAG: cell envelope integrity EipB family protein [Alphaproteobacteria bacterium]|nr:cell envelope integrity EipB family protein [Alphaproteobacteria bacterium]